MPATGDAVETTWAEVQDLLVANKTMALATLNHDGTVHAVAMWFGVVDDRLVFETKRKSQKAVNLRRDPRITASAVLAGDDGVLRTVTVAGQAELFEDRDRMWRLGVAVFERNHGPFGDEMAPAVEVLIHNRVGIVLHPDRITVATAPA